MVDIQQDAMRVLQAHTSAVQSLILRSSNAGQTSVPESEIGFLRNNTAERLRRCFRGMHFESTSVMTQIQGAEQQALAAINATKGASTRQAPPLHAGQHVSNELPRQRTEFQRGQSIRAYSAVGEHRSTTLYNPKPAALQTPQAAVKAQGSTGQTASGGHCVAEQQPTSQPMHQQHLGYNNPSQSFYFVSHLTPNNFPMPSHYTSGSAAHRAAPIDYDSSYARSTATQSQGARRSVESYNCNSSAFYKQEPSNAIFGESSDRRLRLVRALQGMRTMMRRKLRLL